MKHRTWVLAGICLLVMLVLGSSAGDPVQIGPPAHAAKVSAGSRAPVQRFEPVP